MAKKYILLLLTTLLVSRSFGAQFNLSVVDEDMDEGLVGAQINFFNLKNYNFITDPKGMLSIDSLPVGTHILEIKQSGYAPLKDTIIVKNHMDVIEKNYKLGYLMYIDDDPNIEKYHSMLYKNQKIENIISITLDSLYYDGRYLHFDSTIKNTSEHLIYVPVFKEFSPSLKPIVINSLNKPIEPNGITGMDIGDKLYPDKDEIITLKPNESHQYSNIKIRQYNFSTLSKDTYYISLKYNQKKPKHIITFWLENADPYETMRILSKYVRGEAFSNNYLPFSN